MREEKLSGKEMTAADENRQQRLFELMNHGCGMNSGVIPALPRGHAVGEPEVSKGGNLSPE